MLKFYIDKVPWVILFVIGVQLHFLALIIPNIRDLGINYIGMSLAVASAIAILILYNIKKRRT